MQVTRMSNGVGVTYNSTGPKQHVENWEMTDDLKEKIIAYAKEDAANGVYQGQKLIDLKFNELEKVAPNRKALMSKALSLQKQNKTREEDYLKSGWGNWHNWTAKLVGSLFFGETVQADGPNMHIYDKHGALILGYTSTSGWMQADSTEEQKVFKSFKDVYYEAYQSAKADVEKAQASEWRTSISGSTFDAQA